MPYVRVAFTLLSLISLIIFIDIPPIVGAFGAFYVLVGTYYSFTANDRYERTLSNNGILRFIQKIANRKRFFGKVILVIGCVQVLYATVSAI